MQEGLALFKAKVRPVLVQHCLDCHGGKATKGDLDLSDRKPLIEERRARRRRQGEPARRADPPRRRAAHAPEGRRSSPTRRSPTSAAGSTWARPTTGRSSIGRREREGRPARLRSTANFWSFRPLARRLAARRCKTPAWVRTPIDRFILAALDARGLRPNPIADRRTLIRRVTFDLIGLAAHARGGRRVRRTIRRPMPTSGWSIACWPRRITASGSARHWMDVARFAESHGYEQDYDRPVRLSLPRLPDPGLQRRHALRPVRPLAARRRRAGARRSAGDGGDRIPRRRGVPDAVDRGRIRVGPVQRARRHGRDDRRRPSSGLSVGCARCHDHKYDPIPSDDYYRMAAVFTTTIRSEIDVAAGTGREAGEGAGHRRGLSRTPSTTPTTAASPTSTRRRTSCAGATSNQKQGEAAAGRPPGSRRGGEGDVATGRSSPRRPRRPGTSYRRAALANWLTDTEYGAGPLAARVIVNRLWQHHFGRGIVATPNDFGAQGSPPSHPELLDWLATDLIENGWRLKPIHRLIVTSAVYMQDRPVSTRPARGSIARTCSSGGARRGGSRPSRSATRCWRSPAGSTRGCTAPARSTRDAAPERLFLHQAEPAHPDDDALRLARAPGEHRPAEHDDDRAPGAGVAQQRARPGTAPRASRPGWPGAIRARRSIARLPDRLRPRADRTEARLAAVVPGRQRSAYARDGRPDPDRSALVDFCQALIGMNEFIYIP